MLFPLHLHHGLGFYASLALWDAMDTAEYKAGQLTPVISAATCGAEKHLLLVFPSFMLSKPTVGISTIKPVSRLNASCISVFFC